MNGIGQILLRIVWALMPHGLRLRAANWLMLARARAEHSIVRSSTSVYCYSKRSRNLFSEYLAEGFEQDKAVAVEDFPEFSLVSTCRNEAEGIAEWLDSILRQSVLPSEVVICDGGSTDGTQKAIRQWEEGHKGSLPFSLVLLESERCTISQGRNKAVAACTHSILLFTDAGGTLDKSFAERMLTPFVHNPKTDVSMGWYRAITDTSFQKALARYLMPSLEAVQPELFLPSGRALALRRECFQASGGYPEHLTFAGEDSLFDVYLKTVAKEFAFVPDALVYWRFPATVSRALKTVYNYSRGDAEGGVTFWDYYLNLGQQYLYIGAEFSFAALLLLLGVLFGPGSWFWLLCGFVWLSAFYRLLRLVLGYQPFAVPGLTLFEKLQTVVALVLFTKAQILGFCRGVFSREEVERRRVELARSGHVVVLLPKFYVYGEDPKITETVGLLLKDGWFVTAVYAQSVSGPTAETPLFQSAAFESYLRSEFDLELWWGKHQEFFRDGERKLRCLDLCQDALSRDISERLEKLGAVRLGN